MPESRPRYRRQIPAMMAKFQEKNKETEQPDGESLLKNIVPPELQLPTLSTLTGSLTQPIIETEQISGTSREEQQLIDLSEISAMGPGLSTNEENSILSFAKGVLYELKLIEWPSAVRVIRLTAIIIVTLIGAVVALYFVDGFFSRVSHALFEDVM